MDQGLRRDLQHVALPTACAVIYARITGKTPDASDPKELQYVLNDVAHAVSNLIPVYIQDGDSGLPMAIPTLELIQGKFARGAHAFVRRDGHELRALTVQRADMQSAITILKSARITFRTPQIG